MAMECEYLGMPVPLDDLDRRSWMVIMADSWMRKRRITRGDPPFR